MTFWENGQRLAHDDVGFLRRRRQVHVTKIRLPLLCRLKCGSAIRIVFDTLDVMSDARRRRTDIPLPIQQGQFEIRRIQNEEIIEQHPLFGRRRAQ